MKILAPDNTREIVKKSGHMHDAFRYFLNKIADLGIDVGTGSPEGVVEARQTQLYMDDEGAAGAILYIKQQGDIAGDKTKGWVLI